MSISLDALHQQISARAFMDEREAVQALLKQAEALALSESSIFTPAAHMVEQVRAQQLGFGVEAFLQQYGLNTVEGVAIMCLAEALLRIPDVTTADRLIRDKFEHAHWEHYLGNSDSFFVNASSWGLMLTGKVVNVGAEAPASLLGKMANKFGEPVIREALKHAMGFIGGQFVLGEDIAEALKKSTSYTKKGFRFSYDILGEGARSDKQAMGYVTSYLHALELIGKEVQGQYLFTAPSISVKLSALHPRYSYLQADRVMQELLPRLKSILLKAKEVGIAVSIDAEESTRLDIEMQLFAAIAADPDLAGWNGLGFVLQAYQKRSVFLVDWLAQLARETKRILPLRLVKGAYWDSEVKWAQMMGLPGYPVYTRKEHTDLSYLVCAEKILRQAQYFYPQFATHNARTIVTIQQQAKRHKVTPQQFEFQRLHGMGESLHEQLLPEYASRIYAPVGEHKDLLAYLIRRLLENGANSSFVHLLMDKETKLETLLADPVAACRVHEGAPDPAIPLPINLYRHPALQAQDPSVSRLDPAVKPQDDEIEGWKNSCGSDLGNRAMVEQLQKEVRPYLSKPMATVADATSEQVSQALQRGQAAFQKWQRVSVENRVALLEKMADAFEEHRAELIALCIKEAGKTWADAIAEIREAADFCRYYAMQARRQFQPEIMQGPTGESNRLSLHPRGVFACISPWNFPLAIFTGQVVAALVTGNCVIAKPAEQTPRIAMRAVELMHGAGVPKDVLQLLCGDGAVVGAALVKDPRIAGVVFTGSVETAQIINRSLAARSGAIVPLIAETGGLNAMVVDSSALLEQAVDDIVLSAFGSAGQRCSALRLLFVQEDIADALLELLQGAMKELRVGDPALLSTDIGPVIDADACAMLKAHIGEMEKNAKMIAQVNLKDGVSGFFVAPHAFEIGSADKLQKEIFGPVLHVVRFKAEQLQQVAETINAAGYGLTFGLHSRIEDHVQFFTQHVQAGNMYVNRSMIGATVGVQPFGGEGLSGTGPKAGGPNYLLRFVTERSITVNTAAIGGNLALLGKR